jgi:hypothetical protein
MSYDPLGSVLYKECGIHEQSYGPFPSLLDSPFGLASLPIA